MSSWIYNPSTPGATNVTVAKNGTTVGTRPAINFIEGAQIIETIADDAGNSEVDITIASSGGGAAASGTLSPGVLSSMARGSTAAESAFAIGQTATAATVWPAANRAIFIPVQVLKPVTLFKMAWFNGGTLSGNVSVGVYDESWTRLNTSFTVAQTGANVVQVADISDVSVAAGTTVYLAMALDNGAGTVYRAALSNFAMTLCYCREMAAAYPLPATATPTVVTTGYLPMLQASFQTSTL